MKNLATILLLAPWPAAHAALIFETGSCCADTQPADIADQLNREGRQLYAAGDYANAEKTLRMAEKQSGLNSELLAATLFDLAAIARVEFRLPEAEALYHRSIAIRESLAGSASPELARPLAGLALARLAGGHIAEAQEIAERAVRVSGPGQSSIAQNALATILMSRGENGKAEALGRQVAAELKATGRTDTQEYVDALTNLGTARLRQANYRQAELDLRAAEEAALKVMGPHHSATATILNNRAKVRAAEGDWNAAEALYERAIAIWRQALGPAHPDVAAGLSNLAALYQSRKRYADAEQRYRRALEIDQAALGAGSLRAANDWNNLGALAFVEHRYDEAESELSKGLSAAQRTVGANHPDTAGIAMNLAVVYLAQRKYAEASVLFAQALPVKQRMLAVDSPELATLRRLYETSLEATRISVR